MAKYLPLLSRLPNEFIAIRGDRQITCGEFLAQAMTLADALPDAPLAANLCEDRYLFMLAFGAAVLRGQANVLLPARQPAAVTEALDGIGIHHVMHDGAFGAATMSVLDVRPFADSLATTDAAAPAIPADQLSAVVYTSGSTGASTRIDKNWRTLTDGTAINARYALGDIAGSAGIIATVPPWHMYGLEYTVLLPLFRDVRAYTGNTLFPGDILNGAQRTPVDRILVSTPVHLRAILRSGLTFPPIARILCATAPLTQELARDVASMLATEICELYGCSEAGCLAFRNPVDTTEWAFFDEFSVNRDDGQVRIDADHLPESVTLSDELEFSAESRFELRGRGADLVKIGGKRGSLADLTNRLLKLEGVVDAVVFSPDPNPAGDGNEARLMGFVVCPGKEIEDVRDELAEIVDPVFLPRPLRKVDELPRNRTGKLRQRDLRQLIEE